MRFRDRRHAGEQLGARLVEAGLHRPLVLALPRGGVPVAAEVARALGATLEVFVVRKLGVPWHPELGAGALAEGGEPLLNEATLRELALTREQLDPVIERERAELARRVERYRGGRALPDVRDRDVVVVDDGLATGVSAQAALSALRRLGPRRLVLAAPVCAPDTAQRLLAEGAADEVVCLHTPAHFYAVGAWYDRFDQTSDDEVLALLADAHRGDAP